MRMNLACWQRHWDTITYLMLNISIIFPSIVSRTLLHVRISAGRIPRATCHERRSPNGADVWFNALRPTCGQRWSNQFQGSRHHLIISVNPMIWTLENTAKHCKTYGLVPRMHTSKKVETKNERRKARRMWRGPLWGVEACCVQKRATHKVVEGLTCVVWTCVFTCTQTFAAHWSWRMESWSSC